ncbi:hypothetical protein Salat_2670800 [Sesamum alatum]|uniref:Uncharacterized protein n=1 Tax=Sesamum alatum TaxID=300844 RepID=A0AAE1XQ92_9LAMI|nr:hypothetical protein Salat_2670800 [Sesamum alatum]
MAGCKHNISSSGGEESFAASVQPKKSTKIGPIDLLFRKEPNEDTSIPFNAVNYDSLGPASKPLDSMTLEFIAGRDMVRPAKIRFATAFLTLKRFHIEKLNLKKMFTFEMWTKSKYAKDAQGKLVKHVGKLNNKILRGVKAISLRLVVKYTSIPFNLVNYDSLGPAIEAIESMSLGGTLVYLEGVHARRDMVRPAKTHFAIAFVTLKRFHIEKSNLKKLLTLEMWTKSKYAKYAQGKLMKRVGKLKNKIMWGVNAISLRLVVKRKGKEVKVIDEAKKMLRENAIQKFARWMYDAGIPFNVVDYDSFGPAMEAIGYPSAAHCIDLMFEDILKLPNLKQTYGRAVVINFYIYNREPLLYIFRVFIAGRDLRRKKLISLILMRKNLIATYPTVIGNNDDNDEDVEFGDELESE